MKTVTHPFRSYLAALFILTLLSQGMARVFTSTEGRTLEGEIITASKDSFVLEDSQRKRTTIPLAKLIPADRDYVAEWKKANPKLDLIIDAVKETGGKHKPIGGGAKGEYFHWKITIKNRSSEPLTNLNLYYLQIVEVRDYYADANKKTAPSAKSSRGFNIPRIEPLATVTLTTEDMPVTSKNSTTTVGKRTLVEKWTEDLTALNTELYWGKQLVTKYHIGKYPNAGTEKPDTWQADIDKKLAEQQAAAPAEAKSKP